MRKLHMVMASLGLLGTTAFAGDDAMAKLDKNADGVLVVSEVQAMHPDVTAEAFTIADTNGDGALDQEELAVAINAGVLPEMTKY